MTANFDDLRARLVRLRDALAARLSDDDFKQVSDLIEANEFGVALEWIVDALVETSGSVPRLVMESIQGLAEDMNMPSAIVAKIPAERIDLREKLQ